MTREEAERRAQLAFDRLEVARWNEERHRGQTGVRPLRWEDLMPEVPEKEIRKVLSSEGEEEDNGVTWGLWASPSVSSEKEARREADLELQAD